VGKKITFFKFQTKRIVKNTGENPVTIIFKFKIQKNIEENLPNYINAVPDFT